ncbi:MAG TPA: NAD(P)-dependent oxidoreductase [Ohtaekwangia sp.]|uniref:NAD(P)-dependent oxidoreductase n=1 Tax=Ohtaekwangia sp. TaxID=2066019 RepID=UPI002F946059
MSTIKIGWIGLGRMGIPMAQQLIKAGFPVTVYNRNKAKESALQSTGAKAAATPAEVLQQSDIVILMVSDDEATREIFTGTNGLLHANFSGKIIINMSTVSPGISRELAPLCEQQGNYYLDAPVSGSVKQAEEGQLVIMVGGEASILHQAKPVLERMGKLVIHIGDTGSGNTAKLAINILLGFHAQGLAEAVLFAQQHGVKPENFITIFNNSALGNIFGKIKGDAIINNQYQAAFALKHIAKDLRLAKAEGLTTPLGEVAHNSFQQAETKFGEEDIIAIIKYLGQQ